MREPDEARCWQAVARTTCAACLDRGDDHGQCRVPERGADSPLRTYFGVVVDGVRSDRGECALFAYLPLTVEAIEKALPA